MTHTILTSDDFRTKTGYNLEQELPDDQDPSTKVDRFLLNIDTQIIDFIEANSRSFDKTDLSQAQEDIINRAVVLQAEYVITNGDLRAKSGLNEITGADISAQLRKLEISPAAKRLLNQKIIYRGL